MFENTTLNDIFLSDNIFINNIYFLPRPSNNPQMAVVIILFSHIKVVLTVKVVTTKDVNLVSVCSPQPPTVSGGSKQEKQHMTPTIRNNSIMYSPS